MSSSSLLLAIETSATISISNKLFVFQILFDVHNNRIGEAEARSSMRTALCEDQSLLAYFDIYLEFADYRCAHDTSDAAHTYQVELMLGTVPDP
jgi:hypothetical protein